MMSRLIMSRLIKICTMFDHQSNTKTTTSLQQKRDEEMAARQQPPAPKQDSYVYIKGLTASSSADNISNFVEAGAGVGVTVRDNSLIFNLDHTAAVITFIGKPDFGSLKKRLSEKKLGGSKLTVHEVPAPTRLAVSCEDAIHSTDNLVYYFEREQSGGGETKGKVSQSEDGSCYVIEFKDPAVVRRLCSRQHVLDDAALRVSPYFSCSAGVIWDTKLHAIAIPDPVHQDLTAAVVQFLQGPCFGDLKSQMKKKHVDIMFTEDGVTLTCTLTHKMKDLRTLVQKWKSDAKNKFQAFLDDNVCTTELDIKPSVWPDLVKFRKSGGVDNKNIVIIEDNGKFVITGSKEPVKKTIDILDKKADELDRKNRRITKKQTLRSSLRMRLLKGMNVFEDINSKIDDITIQTDDKKTVTIEGVPEDIDEAFVMVLEQDNANEEVTHRHRYSSDCVKFIMQEQTVVCFINKQLVNNDLQAEWEVTIRGITVVTPPNVSQRSVAEAIAECVTERKITIQDEAVELFSEEQWKKLDNDISRKFKGEVKLCIPTTNLNLLLVFGLTKPMHEVRKQIEAFMEENTIRHEKVKSDRMKLKFVNMHASEMSRDIMDKLKIGRVKLVVRDSGIEVSGTRAGIKKATEELSSRMDRIISQPHTMKMLAVCNVFNSELDKGTIHSTEVSTKCLIQQPGDSEDRGASRTTPGAGLRHCTDEEEHASDEVDDVAVGWRTGSNSASKFRIKNGAEVLLVKGEIGKQDGDVMVVTTSPSLNLKSGAACRSLLNVAGPGMQQDCKAKYPNDIGHGELAHIQTKSSGLKCNAVYLTSLPEWPAGGHAQQTLEKFMTSCLEKASKDNRLSILFCAMGTGQLSYPRDVVAKVMYQAAIDFGNKYSSSTLKEIKFVLYQKDTETIKAFEDEERSLLQGGSRPRQKFELIKGTVKIDLVIENLAEQRVDAILCTTNTKMNLETSGACKALVKLGGPSLQADCAARHNNSLAAGQVAQIGAGSLSCQAVYLTVLPKYSPDACTMLTNMIQQTLTQAQSQKFKSLAIPALGTGYLQYPPDVACATMYQAVGDWAAKNPRSCIQTVKFVMYAKDHKLIQTFKSHVMRSQNKVSRTGRNLNQTAASSGSSGSQKYNASNDGCHIGNINLKVKEGDILKESTDCIVNSVTKDFKLVGAVATMITKTCGGKFTAECEQKKNDMQKKGIVETGSYGLPSGCIIHVAFQENLREWKKKMVKCLEKAHKKDLKSLAFPMLGTGGGERSFNAGSIAECLFEAIDDFADSNKQSKLRDVRLIVFYKQKELKPQVLVALHKKVQDAIGTEKKFFGKLRKKVGEFDAPLLGYQDDEAGLKSPEELRKLRQEMSSITVQIYSDSTANIQRCKAELDGKLQAEYTTTKLDEYREIVKKLSQAEADKLSDMPYLVDIHMDLSAGIFMIKGPKTDVMGAHNCLHHRLRDMEKQAQRVKEADTLYKVIIWHHENIQASGIDHVPYDKMTNLTIEKAYKDNRGYVELSDSKTGKVYVIDFGSLVEYPKDDQTDVLKVLRKNILSSMTLPLPDTWVKMPANEHIKVITLQPTDAEYKSVAAVFLKDVTTGQFSARYTHSNLKVTKIDRIQNRTLYQQYAAQKKQLTNAKTKRSANMPIERTVWHGTKQDVLASIITHGFNRSYCESNTKTNYHGLGAYFAADASYSARSWLSAGTAGPQVSGFKGYMFMVKALTGEYCEGERGMRYLPAKNKTNPLDKYDSAVDDMTNPMEFVIFHDSAAYPEYAITFNM